MTNKILNQLFSSCKKWKTLVLISLLLTLGVGHVWGGGWFTDGMWQVWGYKTGYGSDGWLATNMGKNADYNIGVITWNNHTIKGLSVNTYGSDVQYPKVYWRFPDGTENNSKISWSSGSDNKYWESKGLWDYSIDQSTPGDFTIDLYFKLYSGGSEYDEIHRKITWTIPGFTNLSTTSVTFDNTTVGSNSSKYITYTHYGTAPTKDAARYSITGTDAGQFSITALSGTGATIKFSPTSAGTKTATLVINDVHGKQTASISLSGTTRYVVTYKPGDYSSGSNMTAYKVYGTNLTLKDKGDYSRTGYTQTAWNTNSTGTGGTSYAFGATYSTENELTLYPTWSEKTYTLTFSHNGHGTIKVGGTTVSSGSTASVNHVNTKALVATNNTGYRFTGWTVSGTNASSVTIANKTYSGATTTIKATAEGATVTAGFTAKDYTVTLDKNGGDSDGSITTTYDSNSTSSFSAASYAGYSCDGYFTDDVGGTMIIDADGNLVNTTVANWLSSGKWVKDGSNIKLYAHWTEDLHYYDVTFGVGAGYTSYGSLSAKVTSTSAAITSGDDLLSGTGITFTATPNAGYEVVGFYSDAACTSSLQSGISTTYTIVSLSADVDVYVKFQPITYTITWSPSSAPTGCTYTTKPTTGTYGNTVTMEITPSTGYTVSVSAVDASSNTVTLTKSTNTYTFTQPASAVTVSVSTTEVKSTVTVTTVTTSQGTLKFGSTSKSWGATASVGVATSQSITATAASGFKFVRWDLSGAAATASSTTNETITLKADGSGNTGTATAVFAEDLSSPYIVTGGNKIVTTGTTWRTTADAYNKMLKKTGHSTESVAYFYVNIDATNTGSSNSNYQFKIYKTTATTGYYGLNADGDSWWYKRTSGEQTMASPGKNIELRADIEGSYEIKIDYTTPASPKITISYPSAGNYAATLAVNGHGTVSYEGSGAGSINLHGNVTSISATPEPGYRFVNWTVDGAHSSYISFENANSASTTVRATSASAAGATITANFTNDGFVYFDRSAVSGVWSGSDVYMTCLNSSDLTWDGSTGTLVVKNWVHEDVHNKKMSRIPNTNIYYYDCTGHLPSKILFTDKSHAGDNYKLWQMAAVVEWNNVDLSKDNMFVVENYVWQSKNNTGYFEGYWMKYNETSSGIQLLMWTYGDAVVSGTPVTFTTTNAGDREFTANVTLSATTGYKFKVKGLNGREYGNSGTMTNTNCTGWDFLDRTNSDCNFTSTGAGTYKFTLNCTNSGKLKVSLEFPLDLNDYRVVYNGKIKTTAGSKTDHASNFIRHLSAAGTKKDIVSFYVTGSDWTLRLQKCTSLNPLTWTDQGSAISAATFGSPAQGVHNFEVKQVHNGTTNTVTITYIEPYKGNYYIRTDVASGGWEAFKTTPDNKMEYSDYSKEHSGYDYYHCHWTPTGKNVRFCVANDYSQNVSETMTNGDAPFNWENLPYQANVRFMYNSNTNVIGRAYLNGSSEGGKATFLWLQGTTGANKRILKLDGTDFPSDTARFGDDGNWIYRKDLKAEEGARIKLISNYYYNNKDHYQYFKGTNASWSDASTEQILGGDSPTTAHTICIIYDFKTNHLVSAWLVDNETVSTAKAINTSVMVVREHQGDAKQLTFSGSGKLTAVDTVYCVMQFNKTTLNNSSLSIYERALYWISFPFDVKLNDVFGFGTYGEHWIMEYYDGKGRAANGFWAESDVNWKYIMPSEKKDYVLKAYEGYVLALDLDNLTTSSSVWNYVDKVSLYFPSAKSVGSIVTKDTTITIDQTGYECTIDRTKDPTTGASTGLPANYDRTKRDSYWHCIGVPSFANNIHSYTTGYIKDLTDDYYYPNAWTADNLPFYYAWNSSTNALSPQRTGESTTFKAMNSYLVQYSKTTMAWTSTIVSPKPSSVIARQKVADEEIHSIEFNIHLLSGEKDIDHTYIRLTDEEEVTSGFEFGQDLTKAFNAGANIYTIVEQVEVAGNSLPLEYEKTTLVPMGVKIATDGEYSFSLPEGTSGVGVTLIDNELQTRTNLALMDYAVTLPAGDHNERFVLEISPIEQTTTSVETVNGANGDAALNGVCKKLIDGVLYIVKDGKVFDARGARIQ